jgi:hypothetical protein
MISKLRMRKRLEAHKRLVSQVIDEMVRLGHLIMCIDHNGKRWYRITEAGLKEAQRLEGQKKK